MTGKHLAAWRLCGGEIEHSQCDRSGQEDRSQEKSATAMKSYQKTAPEGKSDCLPVTMSVTTLGRKSNDFFLNLKPCP
ncbi:MAG TPA: hypothetical protein DDZ51_11140 [Planctomycetaceae bacterium]|nr:hypothetical protein [Planctomycetaceae bacterium]